MRYPSERVPDPHFLQNCLPFQGPDGLLPILQLIPNHALTSIEAEAENIEDASKAPKPKSEAKVAYEKRKKAAQKARKKAQVEQENQGLRSKTTPATSDASRRRHKKARFVVPAFAPEHTLRFGSSSEWDPAALRVGIQLVEFGVTFALNDSHLRDLANAAPDFRKGLRAIYAGSDEAETNIWIEDDTLWQCFSTSAWPNLEHIHILGSNGIDGFTNALTAIVRNASQIQSIILTPKEVDFMTGMTVEPLMRFGSNTLKYLELINFHVDESIEPFLPMLTRRIPGLEFVFGREKKSAVLWYGGIKI